MLTCIVPIKGQSERLQAKNLKTFKGMPLYEWKFKQLEKAGFDQVVVSSELSEVLDVAAKYGFKGHLRDRRYSTATVPMSNVYSYIASSIEGDDIAWCNVTNPIVTADMYRLAIDDWNENKRHYDCLLSVCNLQKYVFWHGKPLNWQPDKHPKSQDMEGITAMNFAINIKPRQAVVRDGHFIGVNPYFFFIPELMATKIDYEWQFELCEKYAKNTI